MVACGALAVELRDVVAGGGGVCGALDVVLGDVELGDVVAGGGGVCGALDGVLGDVDAGG